MDYFKLAVEGAYRGILPDETVNKMLKGIDVKTPEQDYEERLLRLRELSLKDLDDMIDNNIEDFEAKKLKEIYIEFILEHDLDIKDGFAE